MSFMSLSVMERICDCYRHSFDSFIEILILGFSYRINLDDHAFVVILDAIGIARGTTPLLETQPKYRGKRCK